MCNAFGQNCGVEGSASPGAVKKYFCFLHPLLQQALVSIVPTLSSIYLPWRLNGKMTLRMMVMVVLILTRGRCQKGMTVAYAAHCQQEAALDRWDSHLHLYLYLYLYLAACNLSQLVQQLKIHGTFKSEVFQYGAEGSPGRLKIT